MCIVDKQLNGKKKGCFMKFKVVISMCTLILFAFSCAAEICSGLSERVLINTIASPALSSADLSYNSSWVGGDSSATVVITDNGTEIYRGSGEGDFEWQPSTIGKHTLTYKTYISDVVQSEVYEATVYAGFKYEVVDGKAVITEAALPKITSVAISARL